MFNFILAQTSSAAAQTATAPQSGSPFGMLITMGLIFAIFYFIMIRPQQRKEKERRKAVESIRAGQRVLFAGGLVGTVKEVKQHTFVIEMATGQVEAMRGSVSRLLQDDEIPSVAL